MTCKTAAVGNGPSAIAGGIRRNDSSTAVSPQGQSHLEEPHLVQSHLRSAGPAAGPRHLAEDVAARDRPVDVRHHNLRNTPGRAADVGHPPARVGGLCATRALAEKGAGRDEQPQRVSAHKQTHKERA